MPLFEFECPQGHRKEELQSSNCTHTPRCDACGDEMKRVPMSLSVFRIYGQGAYKPNQR